MEIKSITIKNIRGLQNHKIDLKMIPNKPSLLVAPNGSGKSSFTIAFQSLIRGRINVDKDNIYSGNQNLIPEIIMNIDETDYHANSTINEISKVFDVAVINNRTKLVLIKKRKADGVNIPTTRLSVEPIVLENHVPQKVPLTYDFGNSYNIVLKQGVMPAMNVLLSKNLLYEKFPISELKNIKTPLKKVSGIVNLIKELSKSEMSKKEIVTKLEQEVLPIKETWQDIKPKESKGKLLVEIPNASLLSNGERDIIIFLAMLEKARLTLKKKENILIIDEVFDYLDDANLVAAQYYISELIKEMKAERKEIFPIILTHLNPDYYKHYAFKDLKVYYLLPLPYPHKSNLIMFLLRKREELEQNGVEDVISKHMLHYHADYTRDMSDVLNQEQKDAGWNEIARFKEYCKSNVEHYLKNEEFCPLAVCVMLREWIERYFPSVPIPNYLESQTESPRQCISPHL